MNFTIPGETKFCYQGGCLRFFYILVNVIAACSFLLSLVEVYSRSRFSVSVHACFFVSESYGNVMQLLRYGIMQGE